MLHNRIPSTGLRRSLVTVAVMASSVMIMSPVSASAATPGGLLTLPAFFDAVVLGVAIAAAMGGVKVVALVKGGSLSKCWQYFLFGFICLIAAQLGELLSTAGLFELPDAIRPLLLAGMVGCWLWGINEARKALG